MKVDPRRRGLEEGYEFSFSVNGRTIKIPRINGDSDDEGWPIDEDEGGFCAFRLRAYLPTEDIPDFTSTVYTYHGVRHEWVPYDVTEVIFHPSVTTIQEQAFSFCKSLVRVTIPDTVTRIEESSFHMCASLRFIRLPPNLEFIGRAAFFDCTSLEAVFPSPTLTRIGDHAFSNCTALRVFHVPDAIEHLRNGVVWRCDRLLTTVKYRRGDDGGVSNNDEVYEWLMQRHANLPFHQACSSTSITPPQGIEVCFQEHGIERATEVDDQQMTALHTLCANPHVTGGAIHSYLQLSPEAAANAQDSYGMTPFQYLCRNDITFLGDRNFSSLMIGWYLCMP